MRFPANEDELLLIHNPKCSKSRGAKALLEERGVAFTELRYLEEPLDRAELEELGKRLGAPPEAWVRSGEPAFQEAGLGPGSSEVDWFAALEHHPSLLQRPILIRGRQARIGRPVEGLLDLLD